MATEGGPEAAGSAGAKKPVIVGVGASAGGIGALQALFEAMPVDTGASFVVVVHLSPEHRSELRAILAARTRMPVVQIEDATPLQANTIYVIAPDRQLAIDDHQIASTPFEEPRGRRAPIDLFFRSLAAKHGDGFAVILSGAGADGALGVRAVKETGGIILVQDPDEAEYPSMPRAALASGVADFVLPVRDLAARLAALIRWKRSGGVVEPPEPDGDLIRRILAYLRVRTGHDFTRYKRATVLRRIARRMQVHRLDEMQAYYDHLRDHPEEAQALLGDLLISVTSFFRDRSAFQAVAAILPQFFKTPARLEPIRVWIPACATGEEAYSIAILLLEEAARHELRPQIQVFGTDLDTQALAVAREGRYPASIEADVSEERLRRFFVRQGESYHVSQELRDTVLFAIHSLLKDPPFSRLDLISCRNMLIYLDRELQDQVCGTLHYALNPRGYLLVGSSETAESPPGLFFPVDRVARLYQSTAQESDRPRLVPRLVGGGSAILEPLQTAGRLPNASLALSEAQAHRRALEKFAPPSVLIDDSLRALHLSDRVGRYMQPSGGPMSGDVVDLARPELRFELRTTIHRAFDQRRAVTSAPVLVRFNGAPHPVQVQVIPAPDGEAGAEAHRAVVLFIEGEPVEQLSAGGGAAQTTDDTVRRLTQELDLSHGRLRTMREESEAANEELRAANEELQSINEEYRSTSEELETSKEELQSINEELQTVNSELKLKLDAVSRANSDLQNLIAAADFATLFLDTELRIKRFTEGVTQLFNITALDEGRPIGDFTHRLEYATLEADARAVLHDLVPINREVRCSDGRWFDLRIRPYRTVDNKIDGIVITLIDESDRKTLEDRQRLLLAELTHRVKNILTVVQAIAQHTHRTSGSTQEFMARLDGRLAALGRAHDLLVQSDWRGAELGELARHQLGAYAAGDPARLRFEGPRVILPSQVATPFGLVLHELATNAAKYGSLSKVDGRVELRWVLEDQGRRVAVQWQEKDGPGVTPPKEENFGSSLIDRAIPNAKVAREFASDGFRCRIDIPLSGEEGSA